MFHSTPFHSTPFHLFHCEIRFLLMTPEGWALRRSADVRNQKPFSRNFWAAEWSFDFTEGQIKRHGRINSGACHDCFDLKMVSQKLTYHKRSGKTHFSVHSEIRFDWLTSCSIREQLVVYGTPFSRDWLPSHVPCAVFYRSHARVWDKKAAGGGGRAVVLVCVVCGSIVFRFVWLSICLLSPFCGIQRGI